MMDKKIVMIYSKYSGDDRELWFRYLYKLYELSMRDKKLLENLEGLKLDQFKRSTLAALNELLAEKLNLEKPQWTCKESLINGVYSITKNVYPIKMEKHFQKRNINIPYNYFE